MRKFLIGFWLSFIIVAALLYFFAPEIFYKAMHYPGPGGPFVNTPRGR